MKNTKPDFETLVNEKKVRTRGQEIVHQFTKNKGAMVALCFLLLLFVMALTIDFWVDMEKVVGIDVAHKFTKPCKEHLFGTDEMGRDLFWRVLYASRYSLSIGFAAVSIAAIIGIPLGAFAGYYGGKVDNIIMRVTEIFSAVPGVLMAIVIIAMLGQKTVNLLIAVGVSSVPGYVRITRAAVLTAKNNEYVEAARALGKTDFNIIFTQVLPNCLSPIIVQITLRIGSAIIAASSLSYLGLGVKPPIPEWGALLNAGQAFIRKQVYLTFFPGLAIMLTVLAFNLVGDGLRDAMDPKLRR